MRRESQQPVARAWSRDSGVPGRTVFMPAAYVLVRYVLSVGRVLGRHFAGVFPGRGRLVVMSLPVGKKGIGE